MAINPPDLTPEMLTTPEGVERINEHLRQIQRQNAGAAMTFTTTVSPDIIAVKHDMGRVPSDFIVVNKDGAVDVSRNPKTWDSTYAYLDASVAGRTVTVRFT